MAWRYFERYSEVGTLYGLYRCPANGKRISDQKNEDVEIYREDGSWLSHQGLGLRAALFTGWFDEFDDEISEERALLLMSKISGGQVRYGFEEWMREQGLGG